MQVTLSADAAPIRASLGSLARLAAPVIISRLCIMLMGLVDTMVVGHYSTAELASLTLGWAATSPVLVCGIGLLQGVQILAARHFGAGDAPGAAAAFRRGLVYSLQFSLFFSLLIVLGAAPVMTLLQQPAELTQTASKTAIILSGSLPFFMIYTAASYYLEGLGRPLPGMVIMIAANVVNLLLNLWLVNGGPGVPAMGALGSAFATMGARSAAVILLLCYIFWGPGAAASGVRKKPPADRAASQELRRIGYAAGISQFAEAGAFAALSFIAGWTGTLAVASFAITINVLSMIFMVPMGLGAATGVLTSQAIGAGSKKDAMHATWLGLRVTFVVTGVIAAGIAAFPGIVAAAYASDPILQAAAAALLFASAIMVVPDGLQMVAASALRSHGINWFPTASHVCAYMLIQIPLAIWLSYVLGHGARGLVETIIVASYVSASVLILRLFWLAQTVRRAH